MRFKIIFTFSFFLASIFLFSQLTIAQDNFGSEKELKNKASKYFNNDDFATCLPLYSQLLSLYPKDPEMNFRYGVCILMAGKEKEKSISYLTMASKSPEIEKDVFFYLGKALHLNYRFDEAIANYNIYKTKASTKNVTKFDVDRQIEMCRNGKSLLQSITDIAVIQKNQFPFADYFRAYDLGKSGIKVIVKPDDLKSIVDKKRNETSIIVVNPNNPFIYFSSYGDEDKGQKEIYRIAKNDNFSWPKAINMGNAINSPFDDDFPFPSSDGKTLFFASKGHNSMGGYDIFRSVYDSTKGFFGTPENLDFAINTPDDDILFISDPKIDFAYFASKRASDANNITVFKIKKERIPGKYVLVKGNFFLNDPNTHGAAKITIKTEDNTRLVSAVNANNKTGDYQVMLRQGSTYTITVETNGFAPQTQKVTIPESSKLLPLMQLVNLSKVNGKDLLTINNKYDESSSPEATLQAQLQMLKDMANLEVNSTPTSSSSATAAINNKPKAAEKPKPKEFKNLTYVHQNIYREENKEFERLSNEAVSLKKENDDMAMLSKQSQDSVAYYTAEYEKRKGGILKKKLEILSMQSEELKAQEQETQTKYIEKKAEVEKQEKFIVALEEAGAKGDEGFELLIKNKQNFNPSESSNNKDPKIAKVDDLSTQIENLNKDLATLTDPKQKELVQKQLAQLIQERNQAKVDAGLAVAQESTNTPANSTNANNTVTKTNTQTDLKPVNNSSTTNEIAEANSKTIGNSAQTATNEVPKEKQNDSITNSQTSKATTNSSTNISNNNVSAYEQNINKANDLKKKAAATKDPVQKNKLTLQANQIIIDESNKEIALQETQIANNKNQIATSESILSTSPVSAQINDENKSLTTDVESLKAQILSEKSPAEKAKKLERVHSLEAKILENQNRLISEATTIAENNKIAKEKQEKQALELEAKALEIVKLSEPIETSKQKDLSTAKDLRDYASTLKNKSKKQDAENAAIDYEKSAAKKQARIDSINTIASTFKKQADEIRNPPAPVAKVEEKKNIETPNLNPQAATNTTENNNNPASTKTSNQTTSTTAPSINPEVTLTTNSGLPLIGNSAIYAKNKLEEETLSKEIDKNKAEIERLRTSGNNKINSVIDLLETAQESGDKKQRKKAEVDAVLLDIDGHKDLHLADSLSNLLSGKSTILAEKQKNNEAFIAKLPEAESKKIKDEYAAYSNPDAKQSIANAEKTESSNKPNPQIAEVNPNNPVEKNIQAVNQTNPSNGSSPNSNLAIESSNKINIDTTKTSKTISPIAQTTTPANTNKIEGGSIPSNTNSTPAQTVSNVNTNISNNNNKIGEGSIVSNTTTTNSNNVNASKIGESNSSVSNSNVSSIPKKKAFSKYKNYTPGDKVKGLSFEAEELKNIVLADNFNTYYNLRQAGDSVNYVYNKYLTSAQRCGDTVNILGLQASELNELADGSSGETKKKYKLQAKQKEDSAALYTKIADASYATAKKLAKDIKEKDDKAIDYVNKLDNKDASDFTLIYEKIARVEFKTEDDEINNLQDQLLSLNPEKKKEADEKKKIEEAAALAIEKESTSSSNLGLKVEEIKEEILPVKKQIEEPKKQEPNVNTKKVQNTNTTEALTGNNFTSNPNENVAIVYDAPTPKGIVFKIQIGAFKRKVAEDAFSPFSPVFGENSATGMIRYFAGVFTQYDAANDARRQIATSEFKDCFVVAYCNGRKISVNQARNLISQGKDCDGGDLTQTPQFAQLNSSPELQQILKEQTNLKSFDQLLYTVQVGVYKTLVNSKTLNNLSPLYYDTLRNKLIRYSVGIYDNRAAANEAKNFIVNAGIKDAFVIPFFNKRRISLEQAKEIENSQGKSAYVSGPNVNRQVTQNENFVANNNSTSNADLSNVSAQEVFIKVQIGVFRKDVPVETLNIFLSLAPKGIDISKSDDGLTTYCIGKFKSAEDATKLKDEAMKAGLNDAFLVGFANDKKISVEKAIEILKK